MVSALQNKGMVSIISAKQGHWQTSQKQNHINSGHGKYRYTDTMAMWFSSR